MGCRLGSLLQNKILQNMPRKCCCLALAPQIQLGTWYMKSWCLKKPSNRLDRSGRFDDSTPAFLVGMGYMSKHLQPLKWFPASSSSSCCSQSKNTFLEGTSGRHRSLQQQRFRPSMVHKSKCLVLAQWIQLGTWYMCCCRPKRRIHFCRGYRIGDSILASLLDMGHMSKHLQPLKWFRASSPSSCCSRSKNTFLEGISGRHCYPQQQRFLPDRGHNLRNLGGNSRHHTLRIRDWLALKLFLHDMGRILGCFHRKRTLLDMDHTCYFLVLER